MTTKISTSNLQTDAVQLLDAIATTANTAANVATLTYESANAASNLASSVTASVTIYATPDLLPLSGVSAGSQAFVTSTNRLYIWSGTGWYSIALINTNPTITVGPNGGYSFATDGTPIVLTLEAQDPEELPITWSYSVTSGTLGNTATVSQANNVFTITPSTNEADVGIFSITFTASDGVNLATAVSSFTLAFAPDWSLTTEQAKIQASDIQGGDEFGISVAIDGDTAIVGAWFEDTGGAEAGAAYIFTRSGTTWTQQAKIQASDKQATDYFGFSVSISGDTAIVSAYREDTNGADAGSAYIFTRSGTTWTEQAKIQSSDIQAGDFFGYSVAIDGDTVIVGARFEAPDGIIDAGSAYIFTRSGTTWTQQAKIQASDKEAADYFGWSVAIDGDTAIATAYAEDTGGTNAGAAYIFTRSGTTWTQQAKIQASDPEVSDFFGYSVTISGDTVIVGAYREDTGGTDAGSAYIFTRSGTTWTQQAKIQASDKQASDFFGYSVAIKGDTAIVGAYGEDTGAGGAGAAYIFTRSDTTWTQQAKIQASDIQVGDQFGYSVAISGDTVIVGANVEDTGGTDAGAAYIFVAG